MKRRTFLAAAAAGIALPASVSAAVGAPYRPGLVTELLDRGDTVFLDFWASWCTTCRAQSRRIEALLAANPAYEANISFVVVDWDQHSGAEITREYDELKPRSVSVLPVALIRKGR